jgi:hypothetical protein
MDEREGEYRVLEGRPEEKKRSVIQRHRWRDHITCEMVFKKSVGVCVDYIDLAQNRERWWRALVNAVMYHWIP